MASLASLRTTAINKIKLLLLNYHDATALGYFWSALSSLSADVYGDASNSQYTDSLGSLGSALTYLNGLGGSHPQVVDAQSAVQDLVTATAGAGGAGTGDVVGPGSAVSGHVATFNGTTGKLLQDGGALGTAAALNVPAAGDAAAGEVVKGSDSRLTNARTPTTHAATHVNGTDDIQLATSAQKGLMSLTYAGKIDKLQAHGADVASASTINLDTATGDLVDVTGTTAITAITLSDGVERVVRFTGALTLTNGASLVLPGGANITTAAGDFAIFRGYAAGVVRCVDYAKASGKSTVAPTFADIGAGTITANETFGENTELVLVSALSADGKYCGLTEAGTADAALAFGELVYFKAANSRWALAKADADATSGAVMLGICVLAAAGAGNATNILRIGKIRADAKFPTLVVGGPVYISAATAGLATTTQPAATDNVIRIIGYGTTTHELYFNPSNNYMTHT